MKRIFFQLPLLLLLAAVFLSCEDSVEKPAMELLEEARKEYVAGNYNMARVIIDSLSLTHPKAYKTRRDAELLRREVLLEEKRRDVVFYDETLVSLMAQRDSLVQGLAYSKDSRYQDAGVYSASSQAMSLNPFNNFLRATVKENGDAYITSFYRGKRIAHKNVTVSSGDSFVSCSVPFLTRSYKERGVYNERLDFKYGSDGGIMDFVAASGGPFKVKLDGGSGSAEYTLRHDDVLAISHVLELAKVLKAIEETKGMSEEAKRALDFLQASQERSKAAREKEAAEK